MKKISLTKKQTAIFCLLAGIMALTAASARAEPLTDGAILTESDAPGSVIRFKNNADRSVWVTIYNVFDSIRDSGCVNPGDTRDWGGYYGPLAFTVRGEVTAGANCGGTVVKDLRMPVHVPITTGAEISLEQGVTHDYYLQIAKLAAGDAAPASSVTPASAAASVDTTPNRSAAITTNNHADKSMWVTVYNYFGSIRDSGCVNPGDTRDWTNYWGPLAFKVRAEVTAAANCAGGSIADVSRWVSVDPITGVTVSLEKNIKGGDYFLNRE